MKLTDKYFTMQQAAHFMGVTRQTISRWIKDGLNHERIGREVLIRKEDIERTVCPTCGYKTYSLKHNS